MLTTMVNRRCAALLPALVLAPLGNLLAAPPPTPGGVADTLKRPAEIAPAAPPSISPAPRGEAPKAPGGPTLQVAGFTFSGNTVFDADALSAVVASYVGRRISLAELYQAADAIAEFYASHGYVLASVNVPAQSVSEGKVRLDIVEGRIGEVRFDGNRSYGDRALRAYMRHVQPGAVYTAAPLEQDLSALNALPGESARAILKPGQSYGTTDVVVKTEEKRFEATGFVDNYGRRDIGTYRYSAVLAANNLTGWGDRLQLQGLHSNTNRLNYGYGAYSFPLNTRGTRVNVDYGLAHFDVAPPPGSASIIRGNNLNWDANLEQAWLRSAANTLIATLGASHARANALLTGSSVSVSNTDLTVLNLGAVYTHVWADAAATQLTGSVRSNFELADPGHCGLPPDPCNRERFRFELGIQHLQPLPWWRLQALFNLDGVYSPDPLADTEQLAIGGPTSVRAFAPSETRGDRGYFAQLTLRRPFNFGKWVLAPRIFGDTGMIDHLSRASIPGIGFGESVDTETLSDVGTGLDLAYRTFLARVDWAHPLGSRLVSDGRNDGRVYASVSLGI